MNVMTISLRSAFALTLLAGCFPKPSEQYACINDTDCNGGRVCGESNFCIIPGDGDGGTDGPPGDMADPCRSFGSRHFDACTIPKPMGGPMSLAVTTSPYIYDTGTGMLLDPNNVASTPPSMTVADGRVLSVESFSLGAGATLRVRGTAPLIIASWATLEVNGIIDVASKDGSPGAGAQPYATPSTFCANHLSATPAQNGAGGGGGGGGAMASNGGNGGGGDNNNDTGGTGAVGALAASPLLAAGCPGDKGGNGGNNGGVGGLGGGAIQLTARTSITIAATGRINAGGQGGRPGGGGTGGGGGGGGGGMIGLETPSLTITPGAILAANGGGGGQGGGNNGGTPGPGQDGQLSAVASTGGQTGSGGRGGAGSINLSAASTGANDGAGGGGGGGGAGYITIKAPTRNDSGATFSPLPTVIP